MESNLYGNAQLTISQRKLFHKQYHSGKVKRVSRHKGPTFPISTLPIALYHK